MIICVFNMHFLPNYIIKILVPLTVAILVDCSFDAYLDFIHKCDLDHAS